MVRLAQTTVSQVQIQVLMVLHQLAVVTEATMRRLAVLEDQEAEAAAVLDKQVVRLLHQVKATQAVMA